MRVTTLIALRNALPGETFQAYQKLAAVDKTFIDNLEAREGLNPAQLMRVIEAFSKGISQDKIKFIARREYSEQQMHEAIEACAEGCSIQELSSFYMPDRFAADMHSEITRRVRRR